MQATQPSNGVPTQKMIMLVRAFQSTASVPLATKLNPTMAPTILCVVETGRAYFVARYTHRLAAVRELNIPSNNRSASPSNSPKFTMSLRIVLVTVEPKKKAPINSKIKARIIPFFNEIDFAPMAGLMIW